MRVAWNDIVESEGQIDLGVTGWRTVSQGEVDLFAQATGDAQFIHVDPDRAANEGPYGGPVAHGYLLVSLMPVLLAERIALPPGAEVVNYGLDMLRFAAPVRVGERFRGRFVMTSRNRLAPGRTLVKVRAAIELEDASRPAVTADPLIALVQLRETGHAWRRSVPVGSPS
jgi:acyl dehydratase